MMPVVLDFLLIFLFDAEADSKTGDAVDSAGGGTFLKKSARDSSWMGAARRAAAASYSSSSSLKSI
jgi:hypothetical protein